MLPHSVATALVDVSIQNPILVTLNFTQSACLPGW